MDVELLARIVKELVQDHDRLGLPGVGTFIAEVVPASFSDKGFTINPPYRRLSFTQENLEDNLLVDFYSATNGISLKASQAYLSEFLSGLSDLLKEKKSITLPGLGKLRATRENSFFFVSDPDLDIFPEGFALQPVSLKALQLQEEPLDIEVDINRIAVGLRETAEQSPVQVEGESAGQSPDQVEVETAEQSPDKVDGESTEQPVAAEQAPQDVTEQTPLETTAQAPQEVTDQTPLETIGQAQQGVEPEVGVAEFVSFKDDGPESLQVAAKDEEAAKPGATKSEAAKGEAQGWTQGRFKWWVPVLVLVLLAAVALLAFLLMVNVAPDLVDSLLYTPEELRIINY